MNVGARPSGFDYAQAAPPRGSTPRASTPPRQHPHANELIRHVKRVARCARPLAEWRIMRAITPAISWKSLQKILRQAWHGCNIPPGNEQIWIFCHAGVEIDPPGRPMTHIVKL